MVAVRLPDEKAAWVSEKNVFVSNQNYIWSAFAEQE